MRNDANMKLLRKMRTPELTTYLNNHHAEVQDLDDQAKGLLRTSIHSARLAGQALLILKKRVGRGNWIPWVRDNFKGSHKSATNYMRLAVEWEELEYHVENDPNLTIDDALSILYGERSRPHRDPLPAKPKPRRSAREFFLDELCDDLYTILWRWPRSQIDALWKSPTLLRDTLRDLQQQIDPSFNGLGRPRPLTALHHDP